MTMSTATLDSLDTSLFRLSSGATLLDSSVSPSARIGTVNSPVYDDGLPRYRLLPGRHLISDEVVNLPVFEPSVTPSFIWGTLNGQNCASIIDKCYSVGVFLET